MSTYLGNQLLSGVATNTISNAHSLFDFKWTDHILNEMSWLRADTYSWHNGLLYKAAYNHLVADLEEAQEHSETIGSYTIYYKLASDGHKICGTDQETTVANIYNESGVAWYYILDQTNQRFKLPRENPLREQLIQKASVMGNGKALGLTNGSMDVGVASISSTHTGLYKLAMQQSLCGTDVGTTGGTASSDGTFVSYGITTDPTKSGIITDMADSTSVYKGKQYLYFYVGEYSQSQAEQVATLDVEIFNNKADKNLVNTGYLTNCITEIPQDIKLEIDTANNTITLKAGSKVYIPNGFEQDGTTPKFDTYTLTSDIVKTDFGSTSGTQFLTLQNTNYLYAAVVSDSGSGTSTSSTNGFYYRTDLNTIYPNNDTTKSKQSFPFAIITKTNGSVTSIDQVFNGFGYIGSTLFVLPGVKGLAPNGRNEDGTLKNKIITETSVHIFTMVGSNEDIYSTFYLDENGILSEWWRHDDIISETLPIGEYNHVYIPSKNELWYCTTGDYSRCYDSKLCTIHRVNGVVQSIKPAQTFRALSWTDKEDITTWSMPSGKWIDISALVPIDTVGHTYTAPTNGYIFVSKRCASNNEYLGAYDDTFYTHYEVWGSTTQQVNFFVPLKRGQSIIIRGTASGADFIARFMYAEGEI